MNKLNGPLLPILILLIAFLLRLGAAAYWHRAATQEGRMFRLGDSHSYWVLAGHIARGEPYEYGSADARVFRAPAYPLFLSPFTMIGDELTAVWSARIAGCLAGSCAVGLVMVLAFPLGGRAGSNAAGLLAAIYPGAIGMSIVILSEAIFCLLMLVHLIAWTIAFRAPSRSSLVSASLVAGLAAGLATLARPSWLLFAPLLMVAGCALGSNRKRHFAIFLLSGLGITVAMSPWWIRNAIVTGRFVPTTLQVGASLYDGLHAGASGGSDEGMVFVKEFIDRLEKEDLAGPHASNDGLEYRLNMRLEQAAIDWTVKNPDKAMWLAAAKFARTWSLWPDGKEVGATGIRLVLTISCFSTLALAAMVSATLVREVGWSAAICWMPTVYFTLLHTVFVGSIRYREPAVLVVTALAGCALAQFMVMRQQQGRRANHGTVV